MLISKQPETQNMLDLSGVDRVLVTMTDAHLGNLVVATPVMKQMAKEAELKNIPIRFLVDNLFCELVDTLIGDQLTIPYPRKALNKGSTKVKIEAAGRLVQVIRRFKPDLTVDLYGTCQPAIIGWLSGASQRLGPATSKWFGRFLTDQAKMFHPPGHRVETYHHTATTSGLCGDIYTSQVSCDYQILNRVRDKLLRMGWLADKPLVLIHPGAGKEIKIWPTERFSELADRLDQEGKQIAVIGAGADQQLCEAIVYKSQCNIINLCNELSIMELFHLFYLADMHIGNDSGPSHLAALTPIKLFPLFGPSDSVYWKPLSDNCTVVKRDYGQCQFNCKPCLRRKQCMLDITVNDVFSKVVVTS